MAGQDPHETDEGFIADREKGKERGARAPRSVVAVVFLTAGDVAGQGRALSEKRQDRSG